MTESSLKRDLMYTFGLQPIKGFTFRVENSVHSGIPDVVDSCRGITTWIEVKYLNPRLLHCTGLQKWTARELAREARCWFVMYQEGDPQRTLIFHPRKSLEWKGTAPPSYLTADHWTEGIDHEYIVEFVRRRQFQ